MRNLYLYLCEYEHQFYDNNRYYPKICTFQMNKCINNKKQVYVVIDYEDYSTYMEIIYGHWIFRNYNTTDYIQATYTAGYYNQYYKLTIDKFYVNIRLDFLPTFKWR